MSSETKYSQYAADGTAAQEISINVGTGQTRVQWTGKSSSASKLHIFTVSYSYDNSNWYTQYVSSVAEQSCAGVIDTTAQYWKIESDAVVGAHTMDLILDSGK